MEKLIGLAERVHLNGSAIRNSPVNMGYSASIPSTDDGKYDCKNYDCKLSPVGNSVRAQIRGDCDGGSDCSECGGGDCSDCNCTSDNCDD